MAGDDAKIFSHDQGFYHAVGADAVGQFDDTGIVVVNRTIDQRVGVSRLDLVDGQQLNFS